MSSVVVELWTQWSTHWYAGASTRRFVLCASPLHISPQSSLMLIAETDKFPKIHLRNIRGDKVVSKYVDACFNIVIDYH